MRTNIACLRLRRGTVLAALASSFFTGLPSTHAASPRLQPLLPGKWPEWPRGSARDVQVAGNYAYLADGTNGLQVIDISNPTDLVRVGGFAVSDARHVAVSGNRAYLAYGELGDEELIVLDVSDPTHGVEAGEAEDSGALSLAVSGNYVYVARQYWGLDVLDASDPANLKRVGGHTTRGTALGVTVVAGRIYVADGAGGLPLEQYRSASRGDNFITCTDTGANDAAAAGYQFVRLEGFTVARETPGVVALELFWHAGRGDNFLAATEDAKRDALAAGYSRVRVEGFVLRERAPGTVPLDLFWNEPRGDNFLTATEAGRGDARAAGYRFVPTEGFIFPCAIALRAHAGKFVAAEGGGGGELVANREEIRGWERFELVAAPGGKVALRVANGQFVCAEGGAGKLLANRSEIREWETFEIVGI